MDKLTELGQKYGTDKAVGHGFTEFYDTFVKKFVSPTILEIGVFNGASLKMWEEYYGNPSIIGVDIEDKSQYNTNCIKTLIANQDNVDDLITKCTNITPSYDIIVDDGSHIYKHQISCFAALFPYVKSGGIYILEDLHTSFIGAHYNPLNEIETPYDFLYRVSKNLDVDSPHASQEQVEYLKNNIADVHIYQKDPNDFLHSITSVIIKK